MSWKTESALFIPLLFPKLAKVWASTYQAPPDAPAFHEACWKMLIPASVSPWTTPAKIGWEKYVLCCDQRQD
jgi:hypothetical protein